MQKRRARKPENLQHGFPGHEWDPARSNEDRASTIRPVCAPEQLFPRYPVIQNPSTSWLRTDFVFPPRYDSGRPTSSDHRSCKRESASARRPNSLVSQAGFPVRDLAGSPMSKAIDTPFPYIASIVGVLLPFDIFTPSVRFLHTSEHRLLAVTPITSCANYSTACIRALRQFRTSRRKAILRRGSFPYFDCLNQRHIRYRTLSLYSLG